MSGIYGMNIKMSIFGESHGPAIGIVLDCRRNGPPGAGKKQIVHGPQGNGQLSDSERFI